MAFCLHCNKWMTDGTGKRKKQFCNNTCRSNYWYAKNKKGAKVQVKDLTKPTNLIKPQETPKSNYSFNTVAPELNEFEVFEQALHEAQSSEDLQRVGHRIEKSGLPWQHRQRLQNIGKSIYKDKFDF